MIEKPPVESDQQLLAMLALEIDATDHTGNCPPEEQLAAFIDGELFGDARESMLAHLNRCASCRQHWLEVAALVDVVEPEKAVLKPSKPGLLTLVRNSLETLFVPWKLALSTAAVAAFVGLAVILSVAPDIGRQVDAQYAARILTSKALAQQAQELPLPWESAALGFGEATTGLPNRAFGAGVWSGRATLIGNARAPLPQPLAAPESRSWSKTPWDSYYQFGRWTVLLWAQVSVGQAIPNWVEHRKIVAALKSRIGERRVNEREASDALRELSKIDAQLVPLEGKSEVGNYADLRRRLMLTIQQFAPANP